jgi:hypothetical protein
MGNALRIGCYLAIAFAVGAIGTVAAWAPAFAAGADPAYTVANYPVEATAGNAVAAKQQALADGQQASFRSLLKRIVPVTAYKQLNRVSDVKAASLISGVTVRSERNSATAYIASLDFAFQPDGVRSVLSRQGIPFVDEQAAPVTVVTASLQGNPPNAANDTGLWRRAWSGLDLNHTITPVKLADLKPDIPAETIRSLLAGDDAGLHALNEAYGTKLIVLAVSEPDLAAKRLTVTLAGRDTVGTILLKRTYRISDGDLDYASQLAAVVALGVLEGRWKAIKSHETLQSENAGAPVWEASTGGSGEDVTFLAQFDGPGQWDQIRSQLLDTPRVDALNILSVSDHEANVSLRFPGGIRGLANALGGRGLRFVNTEMGWVLRSSY